MGAPVAVNYALDAIDDDRLPEPESLILIAPAIGVSAAAGLAGFQDFLGGLPGFARLKYTSIRPAFDPFRYGAFPTNGATQTHRLTRRIADGIAGLEHDGRGGRMPRILVIKSSVDSTVSNDAVIDRLLGRLPDNGNEFLLFDVTLVSNESTDSLEMIASFKPAFAAEFSADERLDASWPIGVISLSHVALTFPPDDPLYGSTPPDDPNQLFLGAVVLRGEETFQSGMESGAITVRGNPADVQALHAVFDRPEELPTPNIALR